MRTTIDASGRVVIPKTLRKQAGLTAGAELEVRFVDDRIELEPCHQLAHLERRGRWLVAVPSVPNPSTLTTEDVERIRQEIYDERYRSAIGEPD